MAGKSEKTVKQNSRKRAIVYSIFALVLLLTCAIGGIFAKYVTGNETDAKVSAASFYFTSDLLQESGASYTLNPGYGGSTSLSVVVRNYADELRISNRKIDLTVQVLKGSAPAEGVTVNLSSAALAAHTQNEATIQISGLKNGETYTISVKGDGGFITVLSATVTVKPDEAAIYYFLDNSDPHYVLLTVWSKNIAGELNLSFPAGLIPDNTDPMMSSVDNYESGTYKAGEFADSTSFAVAYSSHVYRFFKTTDKIYAATEFTAKIGSVTAVEKIPE